MVHLMSASIMLARGAQVLAELIALALGLELGTPTTPCFLGACRVEMGDQHFQNQKDTSNPYTYTEDQR
jgi:hypothetical protein